MVDCYYRSSRSSSSGSNSNQSYAQLNECNLNSRYTPENLSRDIDECKNYILDQKELIKKIHQQQKRLKSFRSNASHQQIGSHGSRGIQAGSRSCYFNNTSAIMSVPPPLTRADCALQSSCRPSQSTVRAFDKCPSNLSTSMSTFDLYPSLTELQTSYICFDSNSNINKSANFPQFVVFLRTFLTFLTNIFLYFNFFKRFRIQ